MMAVAHFRVHFKEDFSVVRMEIRYLESIVMAGKMVARWLQAVSGVVALFCPKAGMIKYHPQKALKTTIRLATSHFFFTGTHM
jgi:hypothetical protein